MCGICGQFDPAGADPATMDAMLSTLVHRGPDDEGSCLIGPIGLGSRRLSIIDLAEGHQPIANEDETIWIVFNGEIYNYPDLRRELLERGHAFRTHSDTEVIVHLYEEMGERCVERLKGMFAFALWDAPKQRLVLARDRIGQKPLYYAQDGDRLLFASEVKAILAAGKQAPELDLLSLHYYLSLRFIPPPRTILSHVRKLPSAHVLTFEHGDIRISRYWDLSFNHKLDLSDADYLDGMREKLVQAVNSHLISDVPIGAFLSGGLDSSMVVGIAAQDLGRHFQTFAVGVEEDDFNELPYAKMVAEHFRTDHHESMVASDLIRLLPEMIWHLDEPSDPIAACMYHAAALASRHVKVVLGGDGGDELFAGFDRYMGYRYVNAYRAIPSPLRAGLIAPLLSHVPDSFGYKSWTQKARWVHQIAALPTAAEQYAEATCFFRFSHADKLALFTDDLWREVGQIRATHAVTDYFNDGHADDPLDRMLYTDFMTRLPEHSLMLTDRMTMAHSLEARSPFLDHELVEYMAAFPGRLKIRGKQTKYLLRRLAQEYLPRTIVEREKQGFMFPIAYWFRNELYPLISQVLLESHFVRAGHFRRPAIEQMLREHRGNHVDHHVRLWMLLNLEVWHRLFVRGESVGVISESLSTRTSAVSRANAVSQPA